MPCVTPLLVSPRKDARTRVLAVAPLAAPSARGSGVRRAGAGFPPHAGPVGVPPPALTAR